MAGDKTVGTIGSSAGRHGLALLRLDRVEDALAAGMPLTAGGVTLRLVQAGLGTFALPGRSEGRRMSTRACMPTALHRCPWPQGRPALRRLSRQEWGVPEYDDRALYEKLMLDGFQAGLSWITILRKRDNFRRAFDGFEPEKIARYTPAKVAKLMQDAGIVRNRPRSKARCCRRGPISTSWRRVRAFRSCCGTSRRQAEAQHVPHHQAVPAETSCRTKMSKDLAARGFKFVGPTIVYAFMQAVGMVNDHLVKCHRHEACAKLGRTSRADSRSRRNQRPAK